MKFCNVRGFEHDTFHKKGSGIGSHDAELILEVVCFPLVNADLDKEFPDSRRTPEPKPLEITGWQRSFA